MIFCSGGKLAFILYHDVCQMFTCTNPLDILFIKLFDMFHVTLLLLCPCFSIKSVILLIVCWCFEKRLEWNVTAMNILLLIAFCPVGEFVNPENNLCLVLQCKTVVTA